MFKNEDPAEDPTPINIHFSRKRPDWWPENEAWPPVRPHWRRKRSRFATRMGCMLVAASLLLFLVVMVVTGLAVTTLGIIRIPGPLRWIIPGGVVLFFMGMTLLAWTGRGLRRLSAPLGDLLEAAGRITAGDYSARVAAKGPAEIRSLARAFNEMAGRLQVTEEQRRDLMADITHELRTPLTVIQGNLEGMLDGVYSPDEARLRSLHEETQILARLVEDLRTLALAESGALQLKKEPTDLEVLIGETVSAFRAQADAGGITIDIQASGETGLLDLDPERIRQVLSNLIANALRYTPRGGAIHVRSGAIQVGGGKYAEVTVEDSGVGIAPEALPQIFNRFYKSRDSNGTGLGLPIARHLVEAHGGKISAESQPGKGTTIRFRLPAGE